MTIRKPIVAALVAALLLAAYLVDRQQVRDTNIASAKSMRIMDFDFMDATVVRLENESGTYRLEKRDGDNWWLTDPVELRADAAQVKALVDNIRGAKKSLPFKAEDLSDYGLDDPIPVVTVQARVAGKAESVTLLFGDDASQMGRVYAMVEGNREVFTLGDWVRNHARKDLEILRNKRLLRFDPVNIQTVSVGGRREPFSLRRDTEGDFPWRLGKGETPANAEMVERALGTLSSSRAVEMLDTTTSTSLQLGFTTPTLTLDFVTVSSETLGLEIGNKVTGREAFYARAADTGTSGVLRATAIADFLRPSIDWSTRLFIWADTADMQRIETRSGQAEMALVRNEEDEWQFEEFPDLELNPRKFATFLDSVTTFSADRPIAGSPQRRYGFDSPSLELVVWNEEGESQGMRVGAVDTSEGIAYAERLQDNTIWGIDFKRVNDLYKFRRDLEERRIRTGFADDTARVEMLAGESTVTIERQDDVWQLTFPGEPTRIVAEEKVEAFLERAESLEWESELVSGKALDADLRLRFFDAAGEKIYEFEVLIDSEGDRLLRAGGRTYYVDAQLFSLLDRSMVALLQREVE